MTDSTARPMIRQTTGFLALAVSLVVVAVIAVLSYRDGLAFESVSEQRAISERNARADANLLSTLRDAETGQRGFLLTAREYYLAPYRQAVADASKDLSILTGSAATRPDQARRVETLKPLVREKLDELQRTIDLYRSRGADAALAVIRTDQGKNVMDKIRQVCADIETAANDRVRGNPSKRSAPPGGRAP